MKLRRYWSYLLFLFLNQQIIAEKIAIVGSNYVGLVTGYIFSKFGHEILFIDIDKNKIDMLEKKILTIHEPGLDDIFNQSNHILFANNFDSIKDYPIVYVCVGTPTNINGKCDLSYVYQVIDEVLKNSGKIETVCIKSTVQPGTMRKIKDYLNKNTAKIDLVYNPEFMREGSAIEDILTKNPIIIGGDNDNSISRIESLYNPLLINEKLKLIKTNFQTAEIIKYAWNSFSAIRISYINELAALSNKFLADIFTIIKGISLSEELLPTVNIKPGPGYGGSCFPKDTKSFSNLLKENDFENSLVSQAIKSNKSHIKTVKKKIYQLIDEKPALKVISILGLSFKANTDDIRFSPAIKFIRSLKKNGAIIKAYDPKSNNNMKSLFPDILYYDCPYKACENADCIVVLTDWKEIVDIDLEKISNLCKAKKLVDPRNIFDTAKVKTLGFELANLGRC